MKKAKNECDLLGHFEICHLSLKYAFKRGENQLRPRHNRKRCDPNSEVLESDFEIDFY